MPIANEQKLRVWWIPQIPGKPFMVPVNSLKEAKKILNVLADYDLFQLMSGIKPSYCNGGGLEVLNGDEWTEWLSEDGEDIDNYNEETK